jgi:hypothetical protein
MDGAYRGGVEKIEQNAGYGLVEERPIRRETTLKSCYL